MLEEFEFLMESIWDNATVIIKEDKTEWQSLECRYSGHYTLLETK